MQILLQRLADRERHIGRHMLIEQLCQIDSRGIAGRNLHRFAAAHDRVEQMIDRARFDDLCLLYTSRCV